jgi:hypothetical protein
VGGARLCLLMKRTASTKPDSFCHMESGLSHTFIGPMTENPSFEVNSALSRGVLHPGRVIYKPKFGVPAH